MRTLPLRANLDQLRKQAKDLLRAQRAGDPDACRPLQWLARFAGCVDAEILETRLSLREVQQALAMDYGFRSWRHLCAVVEELNRHKSADRIEIPEAITNRWQSAVDILAKLIPVPVALVMRIVDEDIEVLLSSKTETNPYEVGDRETLLGSGLYCEAVIRTRQPLLVPHAPSDPRWKDNPDMKLGLVSYLGFPILLPDGEPFGTICVLDRHHNAYSADVETLMRNLRALLEAQLEVIVSNHHLAIRTTQVEGTLAELNTLRTVAAMCMYCKAVRLESGEWVSVEHFLAERKQLETSHGICDRCWADRRDTWGSDD